MHSHTSSSEKTELTVFKDLEKLKVDLGLLEKPIHFIYGFCPETDFIKTEALQSILNEITEVSLSTTFILPFYFHGYNIALNEQIKLWESERENLEKTFNPDVGSEKTLSIANSVITKKALEESFKQAVNFLNNATFFFEKLIEKNYKFEILIPYLDNEEPVIKEIIANFQKNLNQLPKCKLFLNHLKIENYTERLEEARNLLGHLTKSNVANLHSNNSEQQKDTASKLFSKTRDLFNNIVAKKVFVKIDSLKQKGKAPRIDRNHVKPYIERYVTAEMLIMLFLQKQHSEAIFPYTFSQSGKAAQVFREFFTSLENILKEHKRQTDNVSTLLNDWIAPHFLDIKVECGSNSRCLPLIKAQNKTIHQSDNMRKLSSSPKNEDFTNSSSSMLQSGFFSSSEIRSKSSSSNPSPQSTSPQRSPSPDLKSEHEADSRNTVELIFSSLNLDTASQQTLQNIDTFLKFLASKKQKRLSQETQGETSTSTCTPKISQP